MQRNPVANLVAYFAFASLAVACSAAPDADLSIQYGKTVRKVGIFPVYPPREDLQVGDVYLWSQSIKEPNDSVSVYLTSIDWLRARADAFLASRVVFKNTEADQNKLSQTDMPGSSSVLATRGDLRDVALSQTLPIASFPSISADSGFTAGIGLVQALAAVGLAGSARTKVTLNFNDVRTYWVPNTQVRFEAIAAVAPQMPYLYEVGHIEMRERILARYGKNVPACDSGRRCGISIVTKVYLTRKLNYTYTNARIIAAALKYAETQGKMAPDAPAVTVNVSQQTDGTIDAAALDAQIAALRAQLKTITDSTNEGASFRFEGWDARGVTFSSSYQRPVVVGWDGIMVPIGMQMEGLGNEN